MFEKITKNNYNWILINYLTLAEEIRRIKIKYYQNHTENSVWLGSDSA